MATAPSYATINGGSVTIWIVINASSAVATSTNVSIAVMTGVGDAVTVGSSTRNSIIAYRSYGEPTGLSGLARHFFELPYSIKHTANAPSASAAENPPPTSLTRLKGRSEGVVEANYSTSVSFSTRILPSCFIPSTVALM